MSDPLLRISPEGLYCPSGRFHIDPWGPVERAVVTHAHSDHARAGSKSYLCSPATVPLLKLRLGADTQCQAVEYGEQLNCDGVRVSLHPAGHILGSAQVRMEHGGKVWVVTGDYKRQDDPTCRAYEPLRCNVLVTESTFGLPVFRWPDVASEVDRLRAWCHNNRVESRTSILYCYSLGKAQRILSLLGNSLGPIYTHGAVERICAVYRGKGVALPETQLAVNQERGTDWSKSLVVAPPSAHGTPWLRRFGNISTALASGWMRVRGIRRRRAIDRGFVVSDHVDWDDLNRTIVESEADQVWVTHGYTRSVVRWLRDQGYEATGVETHFQGESLDAPEEDQGLEDSSRQRDAGETERQSVESRNQRGDSSE